MLTQLCDAPHGVEFVELSDRIYRQNKIRIRQSFSLFIRGPDGFESWKHWRSKISWNTPFNITNNTTTHMRHISQQRHNSQCHLEKNNQKMSTPIFCKQHIPSMTTNYKPVSQRRYKNKTFLFNKQQNSNK